MSSPLRTASDDSPSAVPEAEVRRFLDALRTAIRVSSVSHRHIERELGLSTGYLTRILAGQVQLRLWHVLSICHVIGLPAGSFFAATFPPKAPATESEARLTRILAQLHPQSAPPHDPQELLDTLRSFLDQLLREKN